jgi:hypothetical protein
VASTDLQDHLSPYLAATETRPPNLMSMIKSMAEGAYVPVWELFAVNAFEELGPLLRTPEGAALFLEMKEGLGLDVETRPEPREADNCSTFTVSGPDYTLLGHNEHWLEGDRGKMAVVIEIPEHCGRALVSPTVACCLPAVGMNEFGGAQGIQSLRPSDDGHGIPRVIVSRHALEASDRLDAFRQAAIDGRAGGYGHTFAFRGGDTFTLETTAARESVLEGPGPHTNHYLDPQLAELGATPSGGSVTGYRRLNQLIQEREPDTPEAVMGILRDHETAPNAICLHPDAIQGEEASAVLFSMVCEVEGRKMWVAPGNPCTTPYEEIDLTGVVEGG